MKPPDGKIGLTGWAVNGLAMTKNTSFLPASTPRCTGIPAVAMTALTLVFASPVHAEGVKAGTIINNSATATYPEGGTQATITSNTVSIRVDEMLDVAVAARETADVATTAGSAAQVLAFTVTNKGNGEESFALAVVGTVTGNAFDPTITQLAIDTNGNGQYEPGVDAVVAAGGATPVLAPESGVTVFVVSSIPADALDAKHGLVRLSATATTGSGAPGTLFAAQGTGGGDAVVGATHALRDGTSGFVVSRGTVNLVKSATVADPFGGTRAVPGSIITWRLVSTVTGSGSVAGLHVIDAIPAGTGYQASSLTLDGATLSDAVDADVGTASSAGIDVALGAQTAGTTHTVEFKTRIN